MRKPYGTRRIRKQEELIANLTIRLTECPLEEFDKVRAVLIALRKRHADMILANIIVTGSK